MEFETVDVIRTEVVFKQIFESDFIENEFITTKTVISPNQEGYITDQVKNAIDFNETNTCVINAGVGQGKTYTIMQIAKQFYDNGYALVFAVPYKSLIDQYETELNELGVSSEYIFDYRKLSDLNNPIIPVRAANYNIHLITINSILGNPGDEFIIQSQAKIDYLNNTINRFKQLNRKVVLIFDEIHDGFQNFKEKYIFNLWKWKDIIHKVFLVSATFNEASKIVIKYVAELTQNKIQIIECLRHKVEEKQSDLFFVLYNKFKYNVRDDEFTDLFQNLIDRGKKIQILSYSKSLVEEIKNSNIGELIQSAYSDRSINICTGETENKFDPAKCNIGTTFSTGINIRGTDSAFVIILPSQKAYVDKRLGVFSGGINKLIQAIARLRDKSEIYIIMPKPKFLISYPNANLQNYTANVTALQQFNDLVSKDEYKSLNSQREIINITYQRIRDNIEEEIQKVAELKEGRERTHRPSLNFPSLDDFILTDGEKILSSLYEIFGRDLSVYIFWAAFNDQFLNCRLSGITFQKKLRLIDGQVLQGLREFIESELFEFYEEFAYNPLYSGLYSYEFMGQTDLKCYELVRDKIFNKQVYLNDCEVKRDAKATFERKIISVLQILKKPSNHNFQRRFFSDLLWELEDNEDKEYSATDYLLSCFAHSTKPEYDFDANTSDIQKQLVDAYQDLAVFYSNEFVNRFVLEDDNARKYFEFKITDGSLLNTEERLRLSSAINCIKSNDPIVSKQIVSFFQTELPLDHLDFINVFQNTFKSKFCITSHTSQRITKNGISRKCMLFVESAPVPDHHKVLNLLY